MRKLPEFPFNWQCLPHLKFRNHAGLNGNSEFSRQLMKVSPCRFVFAFALLASVALFSCRKDRLNEDPGFLLRFSADTVLFDTVFTTVGSTTRILKVYNDGNERVSIDRIFLENGTGSPYRINVDGVPGFSHENVEIAGEDSLYIFVEVTLDPNGGNLPFVVEDRVVFLRSGNEQAVQLAAWGQDAYFHVNLDLSAIESLPDGEIWFNDKPHVIYGIALVDSSNTLTIEAGTEVYVHSKSGIWVRKGTLIVNGELGNEVVFRGDRLEPFYVDQPGQWGIQVFGITLGGLWLTESNDSRINYAILENGLVGIQVDSLYEAGTPALRISNTIVRNMSAIGLYANAGAYVTGFNNLIAECGQACGAFLNGGRYEIDYTTFANYWTTGNRQSACFVLRNYYEDAFGTIQIRPVEETLFRNCIFYGSNAELNDFDEFVVDMREEELQDYRFEHGLVDTDGDVNNGLRYFNMKNQQDPRFEAPYDGDFHLRSNSPALDAGVVQGTVFTDLDGNFRPAGLAPDMGCYERQ